MKTSETKRDNRSDSHHVHELSEQQRMENMNKPNCFWFLETKKIIIIIIIIALETLKQLRANYS